LNCECRFCHSAKRDFAGGGIDERRQAGVCTAGDKAKLKWPVSIDGKKMATETYKILDVLGK
jgi:hypothetical protein